LFYADREVDWTVNLNTAKGFIMIMIEACVVMFGLAAVSGNSFAFFLAGILGFSYFGFGLFVQSVLESRTTV